MCRVVCRAQLMGMADCSSRLNIASNSVPVGGFIASGHRRRSSRSPARCAMLDLASYCDAAAWENGRRCAAIVAQALRGSVVYDMSTDAVVSQQQATMYRYILYPFIHSSLPLLSPTVHSSVRHCSMSPSQEHANLRTTSRNRWSHVVHARRRQVRQKM